MPFHQDKGIQWFEFLIRWKRSDKLSEWSLMVGDMIWYDMIYDIWYMIYDMIYDILLYYYLFCYHYYYMFIYLYKQAVTLLSKIE